MRLPTLCASLLALHSLTATARAGSCNPVWHSTIPVLMRRGHATIPVEIDGQVVGMAIDTGAAESMITPQAAAQLGLRPIKDYPRGYRVSGVDGAAFYEIDRIHSLTLGGVNYRDIAIWQSPFDISGPKGEPIAGLLGADMLARYDVALDEPASTLTFFTKPEGCSAILPPGAAHWVSVPMQLGDGDSLLVDVTLNGHPVRAALDSGAPDTMIDPAAARRLGLAGSGPPLQVGGIGESRVPATVARDVSLGVGGMTIRGTAVLIAVQPMTVLRGEAEMLLGTALLGRVPVLISYSTRTLWLQQK